MKRGVVLVTLLLAVMAADIRPPAPPVLVLAQPRAPVDGEACPAVLDCVWMPAVFGPVPARPGEYKYAPADRPAQPRIKYIIIHATESSYDSTIDAGQNPKERNSWHYSIRSRDGKIAQHLRLKDIGWHTGNHYVSWQAIGIEHEGYADQDGWYTEAMYSASATLVRYLAKQFGIPLDRQHILGHDNVPGMTPQWIRQMHTDPGPYWDWAHYFDLLGAPLRAGEGELLTIAPSYATNQPAFTGCGGPCAKHGSSAVVLRSEPDVNAPLVRSSTMRISDQGAHVSAGQQFVLAEVRGDWTAIWYLGQKGWLQNSALMPSAGRIATPKPNRSTIPVYGWALPELPVVLPYTLAAGQSYAVGEIVTGFDFIMTTDATGARTGQWSVREGGASYAQIQFGHRVMFVNLADVDLR